MNLLLSIVYPALLSGLLLMYLKYKFVIGSWKLLFQAVVFGLASVAVLFILDQIAVYKGIDELRNLKRTGFYSFVVVGFGAELGKFILLRYYFLRSKNLPWSAGWNNLQSIDCGLFHNACLAFVYVGMVFERNESHLPDYLSACKYGVCSDYGIFHRHGKISQQQIY